MSEEELKQECRRINMSLVSDRDDWSTWPSEMRKSYADRLCALVTQIQSARDVSLRRYLPAFVEAVDELSIEGIFDPDSSDSF